MFSVIVVLHYIALYTSLYEYPCTFRQGVMSLYLANHDSELPRLYIQFPFYLTRMLKATGASALESTD